VRQLDRHGRVVEGKDGGTPLCDNIRSQGYDDMSEAMHTGQLMLLDGLPYAASFGGSSGRTTARCGSV
jgi:hypothetical protein